MRIGLPVSIALHAVLLVLLLVDLPWFRRTPEAMVIAPSFGVISGTELDAILADSASRDPDLPFSIATADVEPPPLPPVEPPPTSAPEAPPVPEAPEIAVPEPADSAPPIEAVGVPLPPGPAEPPPLDAPLPAPEPSPADTAAPPQPATDEPPPVASVAPTPPPTAEPPPDAAAQPEAAAPPEPAPEAPAEPAAEPTPPPTPDALADPLPETAPEAPPETANEPEPEVPTEAPVEVAEAPPPDAAQEPPPDEVPVSDLPPVEDETQVAVVSPPAPPDAPLPDRRPTPPPQPVRAQAPPEPAQPADPLQALVSQVAGDEPQQAATPNAPAPAGVRGGVRLTGSALDALRAAIHDCWNTTALDRSDPAVRVLVAMNRNGTVSEARLADDNPVGDPRFQAVADVALRAVMNPTCQPWPLPPADWPNWAVIEFNFDPRDLL